MILRSGPAAVVAALCLAAVVHGQAPAGQTQEAARPQRTEADARARAEQHRRDRERQRQEKGAPVELVPDYVTERPDIRRALIARKWRTQADRDYHANRSRGLGGNPTTGAEENLLGYPGTRYWGEHIFVHEFAHAIMTGIRDVEPATIAEIRAAYDEAMAAGKYVHAGGRKHYATSNPNEYWAEGVQWWFFSNYGECFDGKVKVESPEEFAAYDPRLHELIGRVFTSHRIPMDVFHGRKIRPVTCPS